MNNTANLTSHPDWWHNMSAVNTTSVPYALIPPPVNIYIMTLVIINAFLTMISLGCTMEVSKIKHYIMKPKGLAIAVVAQYVIMPLTAFFLAKFTDITAVVILVCGCCPGGTLSNTLTLALQGNMNLSIVMTSCSTLLALGMMPLLLYLYCQGFPSVRNAVPYVHIIVSLVTMLVPCSIGMLIRIYRPQYSKMVLKVGITIMLIFLVVIFILTCIENGTIAVAVLSPSLLAIGALLPFMGFSFGYLISGVFRLSHAERRTVSMETGCQNIMLGATILKIAFPQEVIGGLFLFPAVYMVFQMLEGMVLILLFMCYKRFMRKEKENYQPAATGEELKGSTV